MGTSCVKKKSGLKSWRECILQCNEVLIILFSGLMGGGGGEIPLHAARWSRLVRTGIQEPRPSSILGTRIGKLDYHLYLFLSYTT